MAVAAALVPIGCFLGLPPRSDLVRQRRLDSLRDRDRRHAHPYPGRVPQPAVAARLQPIGQDTTIAPGITALLAPGHTPGHLCVEISSGQQRALLLGDAITCSLQPDEPAWHSIGDVDPALADRTRERMWRELEDEDTLGAGAHFPELQFGRILTGTARRWLT